MLTVTLRCDCLDHRSARALAKFYAALANKGSIDGVRLLSHERVVDMAKVIQYRWFLSPGGFLRLTFEANTMVSFPWEVRTVDIQNQCDGSFNVEYLP